MNALIDLLKKKRNVYMWTFFQKENSHRTEN
jgi:hypothetical protein